MSATSKAEEEIIESISRITDHLSRQDYETVIEGVLSHVQSLQDCIDAEKLG